MVTHRCRHVPLRHAALGLLLKAHRTEGIWNSDLAASIMTEVLAIEEEHIRPWHFELYTPLQLDACPLDIPMTAWQSPGFDVASSLDWEKSPFIPEERRVKDVMGRQDLYHRTMKLTMFTTPVGTEAYGSVRQVEVSFGPN